jgi:hypothetical protein
MEWERLAQTITSTPDAIRGDTLPAGTPYSLGAFLGAQANSLFEIMTENKGLQIEDMMRTYVIPHLKESMDTADEIMAILSENDIATLDLMYVPAEAARRFNEKAVDDTIKAFETAQATGTEVDPSQLPAPYDPNAAEASVRSDFKPLGNKRGFKPSDVPDATWKEVLKDFEMKVNVEVTNENTDKQAVLTTLSSLLQTLAMNPAILQEPNAKLLFSQILTETGRISPIQLSTAMATPATPPMAGGTPAQTVGALPTNS